VCIAALEQLEIVAKIPAHPSFGDLRFNPCRDSLHGDPRFEKIITKLSPTPWWDVEGQAVSPFDLRSGQACNPGRERADAGARPFLIANQFVESSFS
jgi:hypothetical protein